MPIDTSIPMNTSMPAPVNTGIYNVAQSAPQNFKYGESAMLGANLQGAVADAATKVRENAKQQWMSLNADKFMDPGVDGQPPKFNHEKFVGLSSAAGFPDLGIAVAAADFNSKIAGIKEQQDAIGVQNSTMNAIHSAMTHTANVTSQMPASEAAPTYQRMRDAAVKLLPQGSVSEDNFPSEYSPQLVAGVNQASMTPKERLELTNQIQQTRNSTNSVANQTAEQQMTAEQNVMHAAKETNIAGIYQSGINAARSLPKIDMTKIGSVGSAMYSKYVAEYPAIRQTQLAIDAYNKETGGDLSITDSPASIAAALSPMAQQHNNNAIAHTNVAKAGRAPNVPALNKQPQPIVPGGVNMRNSAGKVLMNVSPEHVQDATKLGYKPF